MNKISIQQLLLLFLSGILLLIAGCATNPFQPDHFTLQAVWVEIPPDQLGTAESKSPDLFSQYEIESLMQNPEAAVTVFPTVHAGIGQTRISDKTTTRPAPETFETISHKNGSTQIIYSDEVTQIGGCTELTVTGSTNNPPAFTINASHKALAGHKWVPVSAEPYAPQATIPLFETHQITSECTTTGIWIPVINPSQTTPSTDEPEKNRFSAGFLRILPPHTPRPRLLFKQPASYPSPEPDAPLRADPSVE